MVLSEVSFFTARQLLIQNPNNHSASISVVTVKNVIKGSPSSVMFVSLLTYRACSSDRIRLESSNVHITVLEAELMKSSYSICAVFRWWAYHDIKIKGRVIKFSSFLEELTCAQFMKYQVSFSHVLSWPLKQPYKACECHQWEDHVVTLNKPLSLGCQQDILKFLFSRLGIFLHNRDFLDMLLTMMPARSTDISLMLFHIVDGSFGVMTFVY